MLSKGGAKDRELPAGAIPVRSMRSEAKRETCAHRAMTLTSNSYLSLAALMLATLLGCGPHEAGLAPEEEEPGRGVQSLAGSNGLTLNGLVVNGLVVNGLVVNGLVVNGLGAQGLSSLSFTSWFSVDPRLADMVMKYVVYCAENAGVQKRYTHAA